MKNLFRSIVSRDYLLADKGYTTFIPSKAYDENVICARFAFESCAGPTCVLNACFQVAISISDEESCRREPGWPGALLSGDLYGPSQSTFRLFV
jgi:hypothetical protein